MSKSHKKFFILLLLTLPLFANYSIEMRNAPLNDALRLLAFMEQRNLVVAQNNEEKITASFPNISIDGALNAVLASKNLALIKEGQVNQVIDKKLVEDLGTDLITETFALKHSKAQDIKEQLIALLSERGSAVSDERTNSLTVRESKENLLNIEKFIEEIDRADRQVLIEARIVEATADFSRDLGIEWGMAYNGPGISLNRATPATPDGLSIGIRPTTSLSLDLALSAGEKEGKANIISRPSIVTMNNQPATIRSGFKFYVKTPGSFNIGTQSGESSSAGSSPTVAAPSNNLQEIVSGISMVVTPQITADDKISLVVNVAESQPDFIKGIEGVPAIADNSATTTVNLKDGETTVIAGLFHSQDSTNEKGLPFFKSIPIVGPLLFGKQGRAKIKRELLIFIKPSIVKNSSTADVLLDYQEINDEKHQK